MAKKLQLGLTSYSDFGVIGLVSQLPDYRLVHFINKVANLHLVKFPDLNVKAEPHNITAPYALFTCFIEEYGITCFVVANKTSENPAMFPLFKQIDYFLLLMNLNDRFPLSGIIKSCRAIPGVQLVQTINPSKIAGIEGIFGLMELHIHGINDKHP